MRQAAVDVILRLGGATWERRDSGRDGGCYGAPGRDRESDTGRSPWKRT